MQVVPSKDRTIYSVVRICETSLLTSTTQRAIEEKDRVESDAEIALMIKREAENILMETMIDFY